jgi:hypothetical protein
VDQIGGVRFFFFFSETYTVGAPRKKKAYQDVGLGKLCAFI